MGKNGNTHPTRLFKKPEELYIVWEQFKENIKLQSEEWTKTHYVGRDGNKETEPLKVPYTFEGFLRFSRNKVGEVRQYFSNQDGLYEDFIPICRDIKDEIRENQIIGGLLMLYNPSITQRLNNLSDKQEVDKNTTITIKRE